MFDYQDPLVIVITDVQMAVSGIQFHELAEWVDNNYPGDIVFEPNIVRHTWGGPNMPLAAQQRQEGHRIVFAEAKHKTWFLMKWGSKL